MLLIPLVLFWCVIFLGSGILGWRRVLVFVSIWLASLICFAAFGWSPYYLTAFWALLDVVLLIMIRWEAS